METQIEKKYSKLIILLSIVIPVAVAILFSVNLRKMGFDVEPLSFLPPIYAFINGLTAVVLVAAVIAIKNKKRALHERLMKLAILCSVLFLVCGINSDKSIKEIKGQNRPIVDEKKRSSLLMQLNLIDMLIIFDEKTPIKLIKLIKPKIIIKGSDYKKKQVVGSDYIKKYGGEVILSKLINGYSTSKIIKDNNEKSSYTR